MRLDQPPQILNRVSVYQVVARASFLLAVIRQVQVLEYGPLGISGSRPVPTEP